MDLPLFRKVIAGNAVVQDKEYSPTAGDEVEDLFVLLSDIKKEIEYDGIAVGAILSDYQRIRVENVCKRLGCTCLAYLWRRDQGELLQEMIDCGINAIIIKTASLG
jgi:diphthine-ammonia ligase